MIRRFRLRVIACLLIVIMALPLAGIPVEVQAESPIGGQESQDRAVDYVNGYLMADFKFHDGYEKVFFRYSEDGLTWRDLNKVDGTALPILTNDAEGSDLGVRAPYIIRSAEGDRYWILGTDQHAEGGGAGGSGWDSYNASQNIVVWESRDLVNWSEPRLAFAGFDKAGCIWTPRAIYDEVAGNYVVYWLSKDYTTKGTENDMLRLYVCRTNDFYTFTEPHVWLSEDNAIESSIVKGDDGNYYRFSSVNYSTVIDVSDTLDTEDVLDSRVSEAESKPKGSWKRIMTMDQNSAEGLTAGLEGIMVYKLPDGKWCLLGDDWAGRGVRAFRTDDLADCAYTEVPTAFESQFRLGSVMQLTAEENARVKEAFDKTQPDILRETAPVVSERKNFGEVGYNWYEGVAAEEDGFVAVGMEAFSSNVGDAVIAKCDRNGELLWKKNDGGNKRYQAVAALEDGYVAVGSAASSSFGTGDWNEVEGKGDHDAIIVKYDRDGNVLWGKNFGGSGTDIYSGVTALEDGYVAVGTSYASGGYQGDSDAVIVKYDRMGNVLWEKTFGASGMDDYYGVAASEDGCVAVGRSDASTLGTEDWAGIEGKGSIIVKYGRDGNVLWKKNDGGAKSYQAVTALEDGYIAVGSCYNNGIIVKYDKDGNILWEKNDSGEYYYEAVTVVEDGYVAVGSHWRSNGVAAMIVKYSMDGEMLWKKTFASDGSNLFYGVAALEDSYVAVGEAPSSGFGTGDWEGIESKGGSTGAIIVKYDKTFRKVPSGITLNDKTLSMKKEEQKQLSYTLLPSGSATAVRFVSTKPSVATVDSDSGLVTAVGSGTTLIKVFTEEGAEASCVVTVEKETPDDPPVSSDFTYEVLDDNTLKITDYNGTETDITVPSVIDGKQVTGIGTWVFGSGVTSVNLPDSISFIDSWAFHEGENITSINVSSGNKDFSSYDGCLYTKDGSRLLRCPCGKNSVNLRNGLKTIAGSAFYGCNNIKNLVLPEGLTKLDAYAFGNFTSLRSISIPKGVTEIGIEAFWGCSSLERIEIPDSVTYIGYGAFSDCSSLETISIDKNNQNYLMENGLLLNKEKTNLLCCPAKRSGNIIIPDSVTEISEGAFSSCTGLTGIEIPNSVKSIGSDVFSGCRGLVRIEIPDSVTEIGYGAFRKCSSLAKIVIPCSMTDIEGYMFSGCISLASIEIPDSVTEIGYCAFDDCISLRDVYYTGSNSQWEEINIDSGNKNLTNATIHYDYDNTPVEIIPTSISLTDRTATLTVGEQKQLAYSLIPAAATATVTFTSSNTSVATVGRTSGLITAVGNGTAVITASTDKGLQATCTVTVKTMPDTSSKPSDFTYDDLSDGTLMITGYKGTAATVTVPAIINGKWVTQICAWAFESGVTSVNLPDSISSIDLWAFDQGANITSINVSSGNKNYSSYDGCLYTKDGSELLRCPCGKNSVGLRSGLKKISVSAFDKCTGLKGIAIPVSMAYIAVNSFRDCNSLRDVYYAGSKSQWQQIQIEYGNEKLTGAAIRYMAGDTPSDNKPTGITLNSNALSLKKGSSKRLTYTLKPSGASAAVTFTTSNPSVATVDRNGLVTAKKKGTATITVKASGLTASCKVTVTEEVKLKTPSLTVKLNSANGVKLSWKKVSGAQGYYVYRAMSKNGSYKKIKAVKGTSYINNKLKSGKTYYYKVAAYKGSVSSAKSKAKSKKIIGTLKAPKLKIIGDKESFTISWNNVKGAEKIEILRAVGNGTFKIWKTISVKKKKESYSNNLLKKGVAYRFALRAYYTIDKKPIYSNRSNALSISR